MLALGSAEAASSREASLRPASVAQPSPESAAIAAELGVGYWIWTTNFSDKQVCRFWYGFDLSEKQRLRRALLRITADNAYRLFLDGRDLGQGANWKSLSEYDVTWVLAPGHHTVAVEVLNDNLEAGLLFGLNLEFVDGRERRLVSDATWRVVPDNSSGWQKRLRAPANWPWAREVGVVGQPPWWTRPVSIIPTPVLHPVALHFWQSAWFLALLLGACLLAVSLAIWVSAKLAVQSRAQRLLAQERARIARDIHDELGAGLTQLTLQGELAQCELPSGAKARQQIAELCMNSRSLSDVLDEIVWAVNPKRDSVQDFTSYVCNYAETLFASTAIRCRLEVDPHLGNGALDLPTRRNLLLAVKEALRNVLRHSGASEVFLRILNCGDRLEVRIEDNGTGFDPQRPRSARNGLSNMAERMSIVGGQCDIASVPGMGSRVVFSLPGPGAESPRQARLLRWFFRLRTRPAEATSHLPGSNLT